MNDISEEVDYNLPRLSKPKWIGYILGLFVAAFLMYFPISSVIENNVRKSLASIPGCSISYNSIGFEFFLPKLVVTDLELPSSCFGRAGAPMFLEQTYLYIRGMSFSPLGPAFKLKTEIYENPIEAHLSVGVTGSMKVSIDGDVFDLQKLSKLLPNNIKLDGKAKLNLLATAGSKGLEDLNVRIESTDFALPAQSIQAFALPRLSLNNLLLKATMPKPGKLSINEVILGDQDAPIRANFKGDISLNSTVPQLSKLNLKGEMAFSEKFLNQFSIINMFLGQFDKRDEFYQIQVQGTMGAPNFSSPKK